MAEFLYRTEDIVPEDILRLFVETSEDRHAVEEIKAISPTVLVGSRGVGKSFLLKVAEAEQTKEYDSVKVLPIYVTLRKSSLIHTGVQQQFHFWMLGRICSEIIRALKRRGLLEANPGSLSILAGGATTLEGFEPTPMEELVDRFESSWKNPGAMIDVRQVPTVDSFKDAVEDICEALGIRRINLIIDEAAHVLLPEQQRQFFTLFRDLRGPRLGCNAAVYPGVTSYGESFQPAHDATMIYLDRNVLSHNYISTMREIVNRQADSTLMRHIASNEELFAVLAYAASGNPRILLKTLARVPTLRSNAVNELIREYFRTDIWAEHSLLGDRFAGHRELIDWGRRFLESEVLPEIQRKNAQYLISDRSSSAFFWIHRDAPQPVKEALRLLSYTGIVVEHASGIKATRSLIGTRYAVNLGCLFALESIPSTTSFTIARNLTPKRMTEYGANHPAFSSLSSSIAELLDEDVADALEAQLSQDISVLDITQWQKERLYELNLLTIRDVLSTNEATLRNAYYVGEKRARQMSNAAFASIFEYLSG